YWPKYRCVLLSGSRKCPNWDSTKLIRRTDYVRTVHWNDHPGALQLRAAWLCVLQRTTIAHLPEYGALFAPWHHVRRQRPDHFRPARPARPCPEWLWARARSVGVYSRPGWRH